MIKWGEDDNADVPLPRRSVPSSRDIERPAAGSGSGAGSGSSRRPISTSAPAPSSSSSFSAGSRGGGWDDHDDASTRQSYGTTDSGRRNVRSSSDDDDWDLDGGRRSSGSSTSNSSRRRRGGGSWDDWEGDTDGRRRSNRYDNSYEPRRNTDRDRGGGGRGRSGRGGRGGRGGAGRGGRGARGRGGGQAASSAAAADRKINLRALEGAGYVHLFGLAPVLNALTANKRDLASPDDALDRFNEQLGRIDMGDADISMDADDEDEGYGISSNAYEYDDNRGEAQQQQRQETERKPEAQFAPWLFVQEGMGSSDGRKMRGSGSGRSADKSRAAREIEQLAEERGVPVARVDKGVLNALSGNRPHQGYVLRCGSLAFDPITELPNPSNGDSPSLWLVLDEVVDPQNFGALVRSAHFLGNAGKDIGVLVCAKNSAPPSPVVSAASAGALELCDVLQTSNLPRTLRAATDAGYRVLGAAAEAPHGLTDGDGNAMECQDLGDVTCDEGQPTVLVLGSEGHGLRSLVARACTGFVRIPSFGTTDISVGEAQSSPTCAGVDSLNVSVTGGIMLWHLVSGMDTCTTQ